MERLLADKVSSLYNFINKLDAQLNFLRSLTCAVWEEIRVNYQNQC